jgi:hypothetical protein
VFNQTNVKLRPSYALAGILTIPLVAATVLLIIHAVPLALKLLLISLLFVAGAYYVAKIALLCLGNAITQVSISDKQILIQGKHWEPIDAYIEGRNFVNRHCCIITLNHAPIIDTNSVFSALTSKSHLILTSLNVECSNSFRRFRVFLSLGTHKQDI